MSQDYWIFGLCPSSGIIETRTTFRKLDLFLSFKHDHQNRAESTQTEEGCKTTNIQTRKPQDLQNGTYASLNLSKCSRESGNRHVLVGQPLTLWSRDRVRVGAIIFSSPRRPDQLWGPPSLLSNEYRAYRQGYEADHSLPAGAEVKKMWIYTSTPPYAFMA
jgi:hypothetical protein